MWGSKMYFSYKNQSRNQSVSQSVSQFILQHKIQQQVNSHVQVIRTARLKLALTLKLSYICILSTKRKIT